MRGERVVHIRALGELWQPGFRVAWEKSYKVGSGPFETEIRDREDAESRMCFDSGDLSRITDYEIVYEVVRTYMRPGVVGVVNHVRRVVARPWDGGRESEVEWKDRMCED